MPQCDKRVVGLLRFFLAFIGIQLLSWSLLSISFESGFVYTIIGSVALLNGLYLGGVRIR
ncbi:hypothetical protein AUR64_04335 [Haloprofundus marisrubri]|uniref:Uncharacterized protein n=1 Tax=Haloprofundus marisrubri TaxID=1514971 RepID=A0A0W1RDD6_9EURY|nr:hypothetical protein AUR64_04335 [Haloprofundus marisrubri]